MKSKKPNWVGPGKEGEKLFVTFDLDTTIEGTHQSFLKKNSYPSSKVCQERKLFFFCFKPQGPNRIKIQEKILLEKKLSLSNSISHVFEGIA